MANRISEAARNGMQSSLKRIADSADKISKAFTSGGSGDPVPDIVNMKIDSLTYQASAKLVQVDAELGKSVLDILA